MLFFSLFRRICGPLEIMVIINIINFLESVQEYLGRSSADKSNGLSRVSAVEKEP